VIHVVARREEVSLDDRWHALYEQSRPLLYRAAALMVGSAEAEEVVHESFERALRNPAFFDEVREPLAWLRTVTARRALGRLRKRRVWERVSLRLRAETPAASWEAIDLALALKHLPARARIALVLRHYQDASYEEIASALDITTASVGPLLTRARAKLREALT
jgi:RNA polymerase sigma-70 factor (ECF subfamily)